MRNIEASLETLKLVKVGAGEKVLLVLILNFRITVKFDPEN